MLTEKQNDFLDSLNRGDMAHLLFDVIGLEQLRFHLVRTVAYQQSKLDNVCVSCNFMLAMIQSMIDDIPSIK